MANKTVLRIGNMASTIVDAYLKSVKFNTPVQNGSHIVLGGLDSGQLDTYVGSTPTAVDTEEILIVDAPVIVEVEGMRINLVDPRRFEVPAGRPARCRHLKVGDDITMTIDGFSSTPTVGQFAIPANGSYKLSPSVTIGSTTLSYKVEMKTTLSVGSEYVEAYKLRVVKSV